MSAIALPAPRAARAPARWAVVAAHLTPLVTLPSGLWRLPLVFGASNGLVDGDTPITVTGWGVPYVIALSLVAECAALLTLGLVRPWGERAPRWMPLIGGRRVPVRPVVAATSLGALALAVIWTTAFVNFFTREFGAGFAGPGWEALLIACYAPLVLWAPLLAAVTYDYWRRRR